VQGAGGGGQTEFARSGRTPPAGPGLECRIDGNGFGAVKLALAGDFNVPPKEMEMPAMDGFEAVRVLRELGCARPAIALTAHQGGLEVERAGREGCDSVLRKPVTLEELRETLDPLLAGRGISRVTATQH
jgi:CheY-like chemotaxis protein